jgi:hypothetical protein
MSALLHVLSVIALLLADPSSSRQATAGAVCPAIDPPTPALRVFADPNTRRIRPPEPGEAAKLFAVAAREARTYPVVVLPDGTKIVELDDAFMNYFVIERAPDGSVHSRCVNEGSGAAARPVP